VKLDIEGEHLRQILRLFDKLRMDIVFEQEGGLAK